MQNETKRKHRQTWEPVPKNNRLPQNTLTAYLSSSAIPRQDEKKDHQYHKKALQGRLANGTACCVLKG